MQRVSREIRAQGALITELQQRVSEVEDWRAVVSEMVARRKGEDAAKQDHRFTVQSTS